MADESLHSIHRRAVANSYALSTLKGYEPQVDEQIRVFMRVLDSHARSKQAINITDWLHYCKTSIQECTPRILIQQCRSISFRNSHLEQLLDIYGRGVI